MLEEKSLAENSTGFPYVDMALVNLFRIGGRLTEVGEPNLDDSEVEGILKEVALKLHGLAEEVDNIAYNVFLNSPEGGSGGPA